MINAIQLLKMEAQARRSMTTPNAHTITEYAAAENAKLADEYEFAAEALRKLHNEGFNEGVLAGLKALAESCKARRERKAPNLVGHWLFPAHGSIPTLVAFHSPHQSCPSQQGCPQ